MTRQPPPRALQLPPRPDGVTRLRPVPCCGEVVEAAEQLVLPQSEPFLERQRRRDELAALEMPFHPPADGSQPGRGRRPLLAGTRVLGHGDDRAYPERRADRAG